ncbi:MAG: amino acid racemase [Chloroflexota bacterium]
MGVLGGLGPQATMDFEQRVHRVSQQMIPQRWGGGYPPMVVYYHRHPPTEMEEGGRPKVPLQPHPLLIDAARRLGDWVDFLVITSNTPHLVQPEIEAASGRKVVSIIEATLADVNRRQLKNVGVLGLGDPTFYTDPLEARGIPYETISGELQTNLNECITQVMEGRNTAASTEIAREAVDTLRHRGVDGVILGCTEIPILLMDDLDQPDLINPAQLLAEAAVAYALED